MLRTCFVLNVPDDYITDEKKIVDDLKKKNIAYPDKVELVKFSKFAF